MITYEAGFSEDGKSTLHLVWFIDLQEVDEYRIEDNKQ